tara:strand:- start:303 stop:548 length:246 start_codon:yes stop_codon:yes gene_type:complete
MVIYNGFCDMDFAITTVDVSNVAIETPIVDKINLHITELVLDSHVVVLVHYQNPDGYHLTSKTVRIEGDEYNDWGTMTNIL